MKRTDPGYYPGFHTLDQQKHWDAATRHVVLERVHKVPGIRFFSPEQARLMECICGRIVPQDDRDEARRIPIVPWIDDRLASGKHDGYRYESMPPDTEAYRLGLQAIEQIARHLHGVSFGELDDRRRDEILEEPSRRPTGRGARDLEPHARASLLDASGGRLRHGLLFSSLGMGRDWVRRSGSSPRLYAAQHGEPEPWETPERRYEWTAPGSDLSERMNPVAGQEEHRGGPQGGTH